jgi:predicted nucleic acid-binding protein
VSYWDTSALLKLYLAEADSTAFQALAGVAERIVTGFIGKHEARTAFRRREAERVLAASAADICYQRLIDDVRRGRIEMVPESAPLERELGQILDLCLSQNPPAFIRTNDALHLAAAKVAGETEFVSADRQQRLAATFLGFTVRPAIYPITAQP